jgi:hypothetical protein
MRGTPSFIRFPRRNLYPYVPRSPCPDPTATSFPLQPAALPEGDAAEFDRPAAYGQPPLEDRAPAARAEVLGIPSPQVDGDVATKDQVIAELQRSAYPSHSRSPTGGAQELLPSCSVLLT